MSLTPTSCNDELFPWFLWIIGKMVVKSIKLV